MGRGEGAYSRGRAALLAILGLGTAVVAACSGSDWDEGGVVARVNGREITMARFQEFYMPPQTPIRGAEEVMQELNERLDQLIGYVLIEEAGREIGLLKDEGYRQRKHLFEIDILNRLYQQKMIAERVTVDDRDVQEILDRSANERHFQHILVVTAEAAEDVKARLLAGDDWGDLAVEYSHDDEAAINRGDLGWLTWGRMPLSLYPELQEVAFRIPEGSWEGPIRQGSEYHFIKVLEDRTRAAGSAGEEWAAARALVYDTNLRQAEQSFTDEVWREGECALNADQFIWLLEQIQESFTTQPAFNAVPVLTREDNRRVIISSRHGDYTARVLLDRLALLNPQERDNAVTVDEWRSRFIGWVMNDRVAEMARDEKLHRTREFSIRMRNYVESYLYSTMVNNIRSSVGAPTDEQVEAYYNNHPAEFNLPERRRFVEILVATRAEADDILQQARAGTDMRQLAYHNTLREGFRENFGQFHPISRGEFGALGEAVFATPLDEIGPIVETPLGFSVFQVTAIYPPEQRQLEDIRDNLARQLHNMARTQVMESFTENAWREARITKDMDHLREYAVQVARATRAAADSTGG